MTEYAPRDVLPKVGRMVEIEYVVAGTGRTKMLGTGQRRVNNLSGDSARPRSCNLTSRTVT